MKKYFLFLIIFTLFSSKAIAQDEEKYEITLSLYSNISNPSNLGVSFEIASEAQDIFGFFRDKKMMEAWVINLSGASSSLNNDFTFNDIKGYGLQVDTGFKVYLKPKNTKGFYIENLYSYGFIKFDEEVYSESGEAENFKGTYSYWTLINPDLGYKLKLSKNVSIELDVGFIWKWEMTVCQGDVDNKMFDNFVPKFGFKVGWTFLN